MYNFTFKKNEVMFVMLLVSLLLSLQHVYAQNRYLILPDGQRIILNNSGENICTITTEHGKLKSFKMEDPEEIVWVIVMFKGEPLAVKKASKSLMNIASLEAEHSSFGKELDHLTQYLQTKAAFTYQYNITHEYYRAFNGVAMRCNRGLIGPLKALPMVQNVCLDKRVEAHLEQTVHQIRAELVHERLGYKGAGVLVGVLDTGIDYKHPALGGGFGKGYRVMGGYDFAYEDNDPMDGKGHGTHVAGIIGANSGTLLGVAPEVTFLAVKVLDDNGWGWESDVLAGIEYCLDPDGEPATDDAVDVMNMSFGSSPMPDSPVDIAVNNAATAGVLSVVAAGDAGEELPFRSPYETIGSPGIAESALTVGACDKNDGIAKFSSKGPDAVHFAIKPEIIAPGVSVRSCYLGGSSKKFSGTSMSAPHITGVAALLKQQHPDWTPQQLKSAIVNSAKSLDETLSPYVQGNGCVDALNAAQLGIVAQPGVLSFGVVDLALDVWRDTLEFKITNYRQSHQNILVESVHDLPSGAELILNQTSISLAPLAEETITAIIEVSESVPILTAEPFAYWGHIVCTSDSDSVRIPFGFIKSHMLIIECDLDPIDLLLWDTLTVFSKHIVTSLGVKKYSVHIKEGTYNLWAIMDQWQFTPDTVSNLYIIEHEDIHVEGLNYVIVNHKDARFQAFANTIYDIHDNVVPGIDTCEIYFSIELRLEDENQGATSSRSFNIITFKLNQIKINMGSLDSAITVTEILTIGPGDEPMALRQYSHGVSSQEDLIIPSGSENLSDFYFNFTYIHPSLKKKEAVIWYKENFLREGLMKTHALGCGFPDLLHSHIIFNKDRGEIDTMHIHSMAVGTMEYNNEPVSYRGACTADFRIDEHGEAIFFERIAFRPDLHEMMVYQNLQPGDTTTIELDTDINLPVFSIIPWKNDEICLSTLGTNIVDGIILPNGLHANCDVFSNPAARFTLQVFVKNKIRTANSTFPFKDVYYSYKVQDSEHFRVLANSDPYRLLGQLGQTVRDMEFSIVLDSLHVPSLDLLQILGDDKLIQWLRPEQEGKVRLVLFDEAADIDSVRLFLQLDSGMELALSTDHILEKEYYAAIPNNLPIGFLDVIARVKDSEGNKFEFIASPAFFFGNSLDEIQYDSRVRMSTYKLENVDAQPFHSDDTLRYTLTYCNYGNLTAKDVVIHFPLTDHLQPIGQSEFHIDSLAVNTKCKVPVSLIFSDKSLNDDRVYYVPQVTWTSNNKSYSRSHRVLLELQGLETDVAQSNNVPKFGYTLYGNYPNPFNPITTIQYKLHEAMPVKLSIYDILGRHVKTLIDAHQPAGNYQIQWDGKNTNEQPVTSGMYFYRFQTKQRGEIRKLLLLK